MREPVMPPPSERRPEGLLASGVGLTIVGCAMAVLGNTKGVWLAVAGIIGVLVGWRDVRRVRRGRER